jgi:inosine/xanthosine triphosphatase
MKLFVASINPVKINAVAFAVKKHFPDATIRGFEVTSGVAAQPMSDEETKLGSLNRAQAIKALVTQQQLVKNNEEALYIGLEGGVFHPTFDQNDAALWSTVWVTVIDQEGNCYFSNGARFSIPQFIANFLLAGEEMGPALGRYLNDPDIRSKEGMIGFLTNHLTNRTDEYSNVVKIAVGLWYGRDSILTK